MYLFGIRLMVLPLRYKISPLNYHYATKQTNHDSESLAYGKWQEGAINLWVENKNYGMESKNTFKAKISIQDLAE